MLSSHKNKMRKLLDDDLMNMKSVNHTVDEATVRRQVRAQLRLSERIPNAPAPTPKFARIDLHMKTEEQAWDEINYLINSGTRRAVIITGASGILKTKFQDWVQSSTIGPYIHSCTPLNNGSFEIIIRQSK
jgi:DNA-nicking Smr family endonuclease